MTIYMNKNKSKDHHIMDIIIKVRKYFLYVNLIDIDEKIPRKKRDTCAFIQITLHNDKC